MTKTYQLTPEQMPGAQAIIAKFDGYKAGYCTAMEQMKAQEISEYIQLSAAAAVKRQERTRAPESKLPEPELPVMDAQQVNGKAAE